MFWGWFHFTFYSYTIWPISLSSKLRTQILGRSSILWYIDMACCSWGNTHRPHPYKPSSLFKIYSGLSRSFHSCWVMVFTNAVRSVRDFFDPSTIFRSKLPSGCNCEFKIMVKCKILRIDHLQDSKSFLEAIQPCFQPSLDLFWVCPTGRASLQHPEMMSSSNDHCFM